MNMIIISINSERYFSDLQVPSSVLLTIATLNEPIPSALASLLESSSFSPSTSSVKYTLLATPLSPTPATEVTTTSATYAIILVLIIVVLVLVVVTGSVVFTAVVCVMKKTKSSSRGVAREGDVDREYDDVQELDEPRKVIETKSNEVYGQVGAGGGSASMEMVRNEAYTTFMAEREEINDVIYEEVNVS